MGVVRFRVAPVYDNKRLLGDTRQEPETRERARRGCYGLSLAPQGSSPRRWITVRPGILLAAVVAALFVLLQPASEARSYGSTPIRELLGVDAVVNDRPADIAQ